MRRSFSLFFCLPLLFLFLAAACRIPSAASVRPSAATQAPIMSASRDHKTRWMEVLGSDPWRALVQFRARVLRPAHRFQIEFGRLFPSPPQKAAARPYVRQSAEKSSFFASPVKYPICHIFSPIDGVHAGE